MGYGFGRKLPILYDATTETYDKNGKKVRIPMLLTTKAAITGISAICSIYVWPLYMHNDLSKLEIYARGYNPEDFGYRTPWTSFDYVFF
jgi:hypothetical protein